MTGPNGPEVPDAAGDSGSAGAADNAAGSGNTGIADTSVAAVDVTTTTTATTTKAAAQAAPQVAAAPGGPTSLGARKTYKLFIGGAFPRSESGRTYRVADASGGFAANAARGSRKDARDAVVAARKAFPKWSEATAYLRGQVIYRIAEMLAARRGEFAEMLISEGTDPAMAGPAVDAAVDRVVHFAGWTDKLAAVFGSANPVAGPFFSFSVPEPTGVVAVVAPARDALLGLVSVIAPIIAAGNTAVVLAAREFPRTAITLAEVLATSDLPGGVVNILTGDPAEMAPHLASHADVNAIDLTGAERELRTELTRAAAGTIKRVFAGAAGADFRAAPGTARMRAFLEVKTVWHPTGALALGGPGGY